MALIECGDCKAEMSDSAKACPKCGWKKPKFKWWLWVPLGFVAAFLAYGASIPEYEANARAVRRACEQLAGGVPHLMYQCDVNYSNAMHAGQAAKTPRSAAMPVRDGCRVEQFSWGAQHVCD